MRPLLLLCLGLVAGLRTQALTVTISKFRDAACGQPYGVLDAYADGGVGPYSYSWSNGSTDAHLEGLLPGDYTVTVTDGNNDQASATETILDLPSHPFGAPTYSFMHCAGGDPYAVLHFDDTGLAHGPEPHTITSPMSWAGLPGQGGAFTFYYALFPGSSPGSAQTVQWADANGCPGSTDVQVSVPYSTPTTLAIGSAGACLGNNGTISVNVDIEQNAYLGLHLYTEAGVLVGSELVQDPYGPYSFSWNDLAPGAYWFVTDPDAVDGWEPVNPYGLPSCADSFYVQVDDLSGTCGYVQGRVFFDHDQDCTQDVNEAGVPDRLITFSGGEYAYTNSNGGYSRRLTNGSYTMAVDGTGTDLFPICPATPTTDVVVNGGVVDQAFADSSLVPLDLAAELAAGPARPGFVQNVWVRAKNRSGQLSGDVDVMLDIDPQFSFISAEPAPTSVVGNTVTWSGLAPLSGYERHLIRIHLQVPPDIGLLGQSFAHSATVSQAITESTLSNNTAAADGVVQGSYDPNDKTARTSTGSSGTQYYIDQDQWVDYTIRFQNTGTDTAFTIVVRDTLSEAFDMGTFQMGIATHPFTVTFLPHRVVEWRFADILLPDSNVNEPESHGLLGFRIRPLSTLLPGAVISNRASIYFDYNPPVITEPSVLTAEFSTGIPGTTDAGLHVFPNPAMARVLLLLPDGWDRSFTLYGAEGRTVVVSARPTGQGLELDVAALASGLYVVRTAQGIARFVKQ